MAINLCKKPFQNFSLLYTLINYNNMEQTSTKLIHVAGLDYEYLLNGRNILAEGSNIDTQDVLNGLGIEFQSQYSPTGEFDFEGWNGLRYEVTDNSETLAVGDNVIITDRVLQVSDICNALGHDCEAFEDMCEENFLQREQEFITPEPVEAVLA